MSAVQLLVRLGVATAALPAAAVRRVARSLPVAPLPGASGALLGLVEFGGEPLPVLDLAQLLERSAAESTAPETRAAGGARPAAKPAPAVTVIAWVGDAGERELLGLAVDEALDVARLEPSDIPGEALHAGVPVRLVDLERLETGR
jgi:chemotaxis signal transduction protein